MIETKLLSDVIKAEMINIMLDYTEWRQLVNVNAVFPEILRNMYK